MRYALMWSAAGAACVLLQTPDARAQAEWYWTPHADVAAEVDDNVRVRVQDSETVAGFKARGGIDLERETPRLKTVFTNEFAANVFTEGEGLDHEDFKFDLQNDFAAFEKMSLGLDANFTEDSTLGRELTDVGFADIVNDRRAYSVDPSLTYRVNETNSVQFAFRYREVWFPDAGDALVVDYEYKVFSGAWTHSFTEKLQGSMTGYVTEFNAPDVEAFTRTYGVQAGLAYQHSETLSASGYLGYTRSDVQSVERFFVFDPFPIVRDIAIPRGEWEDGYTGSFAIRKDFAQSFAEVRVERSITPTIRGLQATRTDANVDYEFRFSPKWAFRVHGLYGENDPEAARSTAGIDRRFAQFMASLHWRITQDWTLIPSYTMRFRDRRSDSAYSNKLMLMLSYSSKRQGN